MGVLRQTVCFQLLIIIIIITAVVGCIMLKDDWLVLFLFFYFLGISFPIYFSLTHSFKWAYHHYTTIKSTNTHLCLCLCPPCRQFAQSDGTGWAWSRPLPPPQTSQLPESRCRPPLTPGRHLRDRQRQITSVQSSILHPKMQLPKATFVKTQ